jgi:hypothetical protein
VGHCPAAPILPCPSPVPAVAAVPGTRSRLAAVDHVPSDETEPEMSQRNVERVIGRLVTDEELRLEFIRAPKKTLSALAEQGCELSGVEVDALLHTDIGLWAHAAARVDPGLQHCSLKAGEEGREHP